MNEKTEGNITYPGYEHMRLEAMIKTMDTNKLFAYTWCPVADASGNAPLGGIETLVEFKLQPITKRFCVQSRHHKKERWYLPRLPSSQTYAEPNLS